jgi:hypothetical protein
MDAPSSSPPIPITSESVFSRAYLKGIPEERKQALFTSIIKSFHDSLIINAASGKDHYVLMGSTIEVFRNRTDSWTNAVSTSFTNLELIARIEKKYPGCKVYEEEKNIVIDWS